MSEKKVYKAWECGLCKTWHRKIGGVNRAPYRLCVNIPPPMKNGGCGYGCPLLHHNDDGDFCIEDYAIKSKDSLMIKPGPACPRYEASKRCFYKTSSGQITIRPERGMEKDEKMDCHKATTNDHGNGLR